MKLIKIFVAVISALIICFTTASCGNSYKDAFIYIELNNKPQTLDPQLAQSIEEITVARSIFDTLLRYDNQGNIVASGAESYTQKGNTYIFELDRKAKWTDGRAVTADDYVFAFRRAVNPETDAPFANNLYSIKNAEEIHLGEQSLSSLGVEAVDEFTLKIELEYNDPDFLKVLTMPVSAPCNENFFKESKGKYGRTVENTPSNGSYYVRVWTTETKFLIRLAKNLDYKGYFEANSMRIYYTCSDIDNARLIKDENTDIAYIGTSQYSDIISYGANITSTEDTCFVLFANEEIDPNIRTALLKSIDNKFNNCELYETQQLANNLFPAVLGVNNVKNTDNYIVNDDIVAQELYSTYIKETGKPLNLKIIYPSDKTSEEFAKQLAAHWQNKLSCFINIESNSLSTINNNYYANNYDLIIVPITAYGGILSSYIGKLGLNISNTEKLQKELFQNYLCYPLFYSSTNIGAISTISNLNDTIHNGIMDVSLLIKNK